VVGGATMFSEASLVWGEDVIFFQVQDKSGVYDAFNDFTKAVG
jgi:hypothetical protein